MRRITRFRPTPAMVVASIALLVALGGTSAAAVALVPKNSVGSDQVINGSLKNKDFKEGQVLAATGMVSRSVDGPVVPSSGDTFSTIASLAISKPGAYVIWSTARVEGKNIGGECHLLAGDSIDVSKFGSGCVDGDALERRGPVVRVSRERRPPVRRHREGAIAGQRHQARRDQDRGLQRVVSTPTQEQGGKSCSASPASAPLPRWSSPRSRCSSRSAARASRQ